MAAIAGLAEVVLNVADLEASLRFYRDTLGMDVIGTPQGKPAPVFLRAGEPEILIPQMVVLVPLGPGSGSFAGPRPLHHFAFEVDPAAFESEKKRLVEAGLQVRTGEHPIIASRTLYIDDPDGNEVELIAGPSG